MTDEEVTSNFNTNETLIYNLTKRVCELEEENNYLTQVTKELNKKLKEDVESLASINVKAQGIIAELKAQNKGLIHLLESIQSAVSVIKKNKDKDIVLYWIEENAIRVYKQEKQKGFSFDWLK